MNTDILDQMFPESPTEEDSEICDRVLKTLRSAGTDYEAKSWEETGFFLKEHPRFKEWGDHFLKVASKFK